MTPYITIYNLQIFKCQTNSYQLTLFRLTSGLLKIVRGGAVIYVSLICKYEKFQILIAISRLTKICKNKQFLKYDKFNIFEKPYATANFQKLNIKKK